MPKTAFQNLRTMTAALLLAAVTLFVVPASAQKPVDGKKAKEASQKSSSASELDERQLSQPGEPARGFRSAAVRSQTIEALKRSTGVA